MKKNMNSYKVHEREIADTVVNYDSSSNNEDMHSNSFLDRSLYKLSKGFAGLAILGMLAYGCGTHETTQKHKKMDRTEILNDTILKSNRTPMQRQIALADLMTYKIYDDKFKSKSNIDGLISANLYQYSLEDLVDMRAISSHNYNQKDLWLVLGLKNSNYIDFYKGMKDSWDDKISRFSKRSSLNQTNILRDEKNKSLKKIRNKTTKSSLRDYRSDEIGTGIELLNELTDNYLKDHYTSKSESDVEMRKLLLQVKNTFSPNVLLGYNLQELMPPCIGKDTMNAASKVYMLDRILKEGGKEVLERMPARYDVMLSYGPFQLTKYPLKDIQNKKFNNYVSKKYQVPVDMQHMDNLQDHVNGAVMFAFNNWMGLGEYLKKKKLLKKFNEGFSSMDKFEKSIVLTGITGCLHHQPKNTKQSLENYVKWNSIKDMHYKIPLRLSNQLKKYYTSTAESYLIMKVFDKLDDKYSK